MADIKSINGNPIVVGTSGIEDGAVTDAKLASGSLPTIKKDTYDGYLDGVEWELGGFNRTNGAVISLNGAARTWPFHCEAGTIFAVEQGAIIGGAEYNPNATILPTGNISPDNLIAIRGAGDSSNRMTYVVQNDCLLRLVVKIDPTVIIDDPMIAASKVYKYRPKLDLFKRMTSEETDNLFDHTHVFVEKGSVGTSGQFTEFPQAYSAIVQVEPSTSYCVTKRHGSRLRVGTSENYPIFNDTLSNVDVEPLTMAKIVTTGENDHWLIIQYYYSVEDEANYDAGELLKSIKVTKTDIVGNVPSSTTALDGIARYLTSESIDQDYGTPRLFIHNPEIEERVLLQKFNIKHAHDITYVRNNITTDMIHALWDNLVENYPRNVDEPIVIGHSIDETGAQYKEIRAYRVHQVESVGASGRYPILYDPAIPKYFFVGATHGIEKSATYSMYTIFERMLGTSSMYSHLLRDSVYWVIPVLNSWGFDHNSRYLAESVNSGESPLTDPNRQCAIPLDIPDYAPEISALIAFLSDKGIGDNPNNVFIDFHNCNSIQGYLASDKPRDRHLYDAMMTELANAWRYRSTDGNGSPTAYYGDPDLPIGNLTRNISVGGIETSHAWYVGQTFNIRTSVIHESLNASSLVNASNADGYFTGYALSKELDMQYGFINEIWKDNQTRLAIAAASE